MNNNANQVLREMNEALAKMEWPQLPRKKRRSVERRQRRPPRPKTLAGQKLFAWPEERDGTQVSRDEA